MRPYTKLEEPAISYTTDPADPSLFRPSARHAAVTEASKRRRYVGRFKPAPEHVRVSKLERLGGLLAGLGRISAEVGNASLELIGAPCRQTFVEYESSADAKDEAQAVRLLRYVQIQHKNGRIRLINPRHRRGRSCHTEFFIIGPGERPVSVSGTYAAIRVADMRGGVDVNTTHARITLLNVTSIVNARVEEGMIDYSGQEGSVRLFAGWELNLDFILPHFKGQMEATAVGPVRVLLPEGFGTSFEASIAKDACFVCRADIATRITQREQEGRTIFRFGEEPPAIRLTSLKGPIVIDSRNGTCGNGLPLSDNVVSMFGLKTRGKDPTDDRCSFCSKPRNKVVNLVANPSRTAYICNECIEGAFSVLVKGQEAKTPKVAR